MGKRPSIVVVLGVCALGLAMPAAVFADFYDSFDDGYYDRSDPNMPGYDANDPYYTDPNNAVLWDIDNPDWEILELIIGNPYWTSQPGLLRLWTDYGILPYAFLGGVVQDGDFDPNTSMTYLDNSGPHYIVSYIHVHTPRTGMAGVWMHLDVLHWTAYDAEYEPRDGWMALTSYNATDFDQAVTTSRLWYPFDPNLCDPNITDPNDPNFIDANYPDDYPNPKGYPLPPGYPYAPDLASFWRWWWTHHDPNDPDPNASDPNYINDFSFKYHPNAPDPNGFWMVLQFDPNGLNGDANHPENPDYDPNDPNCHWLRMAVWNGGKYDWDGTWLLEASVVDNDWTSHEYELYWPEGDHSVAAFAGGESNAPADIAYDNIEVRWGYWTDVSHTLSLTVKNAQMGTITIDPDLLDDVISDNMGGEKPGSSNLDPNDYDPPMDPNLLRRYTNGTEVVLVAEAVSGKSFKEWKIFDPNHPGDSGYAVIDTNTTLYLTMDADWEIEASFKCGSSELLMPLGLALLVLAVGVTVRRLM